MVPVALLSIYMTPWAIGKAEQFRHQLENRDDATAVSPGVFKESKNADRVFFVEKLSPRPDAGRQCLRARGARWPACGWAWRAAATWKPGAERRSLPGGAERPPLRRHAGPGRLSGGGVRQVRRAHRAERRPRASSLRRSRAPPRLLLHDPSPANRGRAVVALRPARLQRPAAGFAGDPDERGEPAHRPLREPARGGVRVHDLQQPGQHRRRPGSRRARSPSWSGCGPCTAA